MSYWDSVHNLLKNNNRILNKTDAKSSYFDLIVNAHVPEKFAFELISLLELLEFSACEMWIDSYFWKHSPVSQEELNEIKSFIPDDTSQFNYYSDNLINTQIKIYEHVLQKINLKKNSAFDRHLHDSLSKELFCYKRGHNLVKLYLNNH